MTTPKTDSERFWPKVNKQTSCWEWTAYINESGYGVFKSAGRPARAHRVSYEMANGPIPEGLELDHLCRNRKCVNPEHLEAVEKPVNILRGVGTGAINARKTHCVNGHPLTADNIYASALPYRQCITCARTYAASRKRRLKEQRTSGITK